MGDIREAKITRVNIKEGNKSKIIIIYKKRRDAARPKDVC
jgi:hypothetical protein